MCIYLQAANLEMELNKCIGGNKLRFLCFFKSRKLDSIETVWMMLYRQGDDAVTGAPTRDGLAGWNEIVTPWRRMDD